MFTKQHLEAIAEVISNNSGVIAVKGDYGRGFEDGTQATAREIARDFARLFAKDNPKFDAAKFYAACGFSS